MVNGPFPDEIEMSDGEAIVTGVLYVADTIVVAEEDGTAADLKTLLGATTITTCNVSARRSHASDFDVLDT